MGSVLRTHAMRLGQESGAESPSPGKLGAAGKGERPLTCHPSHIPGEPGAKPFVRDLLPGRGFTSSRVAPSLPSTGKEDLALAECHLYL